MSEPKDLITLTNNGGVIEADVAGGALVAWVITQKKEGVTEKAAIRDLQKKLKVACEVAIDLVRGS